VVVLLILLGLLGYITAFEADPAADRPVGAAAGGQPGCTCWPLPRGALVFSDR